MIEARTGLVSWPTASRDRSSPKYSELTDADLVGLLARQDGAALEALYERHLKVAFAVSVRILTDHQRAEDVVQEAFVKLWRQPGLFDPARGRFQPWFLQLVHHRAVDALRSSVRERTESADDPDSELWETLADPKAHPEELAIGTLDREAVEDALDLLPFVQREAIELAYFGGLTQAEIAARLGEPLGTVKTRIRLGMGRLRALLLQARKGPDAA
jgi:RNA polymerase sigma-70 factor (ECF subfamily)